MSSEAQQKIDGYLNSLRGRLRGLNHEDVQEIVEELRGHILEKAGGVEGLSGRGVDAALAGLGSPEELASEYVTDNLLARAEVSRSPLRILESLFRWASLSVAGFFVLLGSILGYFVGGAFMWCAVLKLIHPQSAGLWVARDSTGDFQFFLRMGFGTPPVGARDVLGWWIMPIGLLAGCGLVILTTRIALWCAQQYRKSHLRQRG
jgi:Protein of unknown function (DUF1700)